MKPAHQRAADQRDMKTGDREKMGKTHGCDGLSLFVSERSSVAENQRSRNAGDLLGKAIDHAAPHSVTSASDPLPRF